MDEINELAIPEPRPDPLAHLTTDQRVIVRLMRHSADKMDRSLDTAEQHTAALLRLAADAVVRQYENVLVAVAVAWGREREGKG